MIEAKFQCMNPYVVSKMLDWCDQQFGQMAPDLYSVGDQFRWGFRIMAQEMLFHFDNDRDYAWFILRWS